MRSFSLFFLFFLSFSFIIPSPVIVQNVLASEAASLISKEEFLSSDFPKHFKSREFKKALSVLDGMIKKYPDDPLILRYRALTFDKLSRRKEAISEYKKILSQDPNHVPARLFLGLAYARDKQPGKAIQELQWVVQNSNSEKYRHWAQAQLTRVKRGGKKVGKPVQKKPYLLGKVGAYYDSNSLLVPDAENLSSRKREEGMDFPINLNVGYPLILEKEFRLDALYVGQTLLHDEDTSDVDFTSQGAALDAKKRVFFGDRAVLFGGRYDFKANFLRSDLFSVINRFLLSMDTSFWKKTRTKFYARTSYSNYGPDGSAPPITSRDGFRGGAGIVQTFFLAKDFRTYFFVKQELSFADTRGENFNREGSLTRLGIHAPLDFLGPVDLDASTGFDYGTYPEFSSLSVLDLNERQDMRADVYAALTYHWKPDLATRGFYRYINSNNDNDFYERDRHIAGVEVVFSI